MSMPLTRLLKDFSAPPAPAPSLSAQFELSEQDPFEMDFPALPEPEPINLEDIRREAYAAGHEAGEKAAEERLEVDRQAAEVAHSQAVAEIEARFRDDMTKALGERLPAIINELSLAISDQVAVALAPLFAEAVAEKAVSDLAGLLKTAINSGEAGVIELRGPKALFAMLAEQMPDQLGLLHHVEADDLDLSAEFAEAALVTRISAFAASLRKVIG
jgi:hypothetical protein